MGTLELTAVLDVVAFGQGDLAAYRAFHIGNDAAYVASRDVRGDDQLALHVLACDGARTVGGDNLRHLAQRHFASVAGVDKRIAHGINAVRIVFVETQHNVHRPLPLVDVADLLAAESEVDEAVEIIDGDAVLREGEPVGTHLQLGRLCLLLHRHIHQTVNAADGTLDLIAEHLQAAEVGAEEFDSYVRPCAGKHVVDAVTERLPHRDGDAGDSTEPRTDVIEELLTAASVEPELHIQFGTVDRLGMFVQLAPSCAPCRTRDLGDSEQFALHEVA